MGTRSRVGIMENGLCKSVYCHYDGYLEYTGKVLFERWGSETVNQLLERGDNSGIQETVEEMNFYADRGEEDVSYEVDASFGDFLDRVDRCCGEWYYVLKDDVWYVGNLYSRDERHYRKLVPLAESLELLVEEDAV